MAHLDLTGVVNDAVREALRAQLPAIRDAHFTEAAEILLADTTVMGEPGDQYAAAFANLLLAARPGCPDPIECDHEAAVGQLREQLDAAQAELLRTRIRLLARDTENDQLNAELTKADEAYSEACEQGLSYRRRWESTVVEAQRQDARANAAQAENERLRALLAHDHHLAYHQGEPRDGHRNCGRDSCTAPAARPSV